MNTRDDSIEQATQAAEQAFWQVIAERFPLVKTGDFPPDAAIKLSEAMKAAVSTWLSINASEPYPEVAGREFTLDGEPCDLENFIAVNEFSRDDVQEILALEAGEFIRYGGGAAALFTLRRVL